MKFKSSFALVVLLAMVFQLAVAATASANTERVDLFQDFSTDIADDDPLWYINGTTVKDGILVGPEDGAYGIACKKKIETAGTYTVEFDLQSSAKNDIGIGNRTTFIGLRTGQYKDDPQWETAFYIAIRNGGIGFRTERWANVSYVQMPFNFYEMRHVKIVDDTVNDVIRVYVTDDSGKEVPVARYTIEEDRIVSLYAEGESQPSVVKTMKADILDNGHVVFWSHLISEIKMDNLHIYYDYVPVVYTPSDKLKYDDTLMDTWVATDDLGRSTPLYEDVGAPRDKVIGMFYYPWHDQRLSVRSTWTIYDHDAAYMEGGVDAVWEILQQGPEGWGHYWAQPYFGYYISDDEWIIRKHANMLTAAGVDFIFFDVSNGKQFTHIYERIFKVYKEMRNEGQQTPQICFAAGVRPDLAVYVVEEMWKSIYSSGRYRDLWFMWEGKPLLLGDISQVDPEITSFFTNRECWAYSDWAKGDGVGRWTWMHETPQMPGLDFEGNLEQISVSCGFHVNNSRGRSYHNNMQPTDGLGDFEYQLETTPYGLAFEEQWGEAHRVDPRMVLLTQWNEWIAGRGIGSKALIANTYIADSTHPIYGNVYIDEFNREFSRDLEPMKGGFKDNYYYQMVQNIRKFRGVRPIPAASGFTSVDLNGSFKQWDGVWPEYKDTRYDITHRDAYGHAMKVSYTNTTGRNDIKNAKVTHDNANWYFYVDTMSELTTPQGENYMNLFIDADQSTKTGWEGYDYIINRSRDGEKLSVEKNTDGTFTWKKIADVPYRIEGNKMHLSIPKSLINLTEFDFKWADNSTTSGEIMEFMDLGDAAPDSRFNFRYTEKAQEIEKSEKLANAVGDGVVMKINRNTAFKNTKTVKVDEGNTQVTPMIVNGKTLVPARFVSESLGADVMWNDRTFTATVIKEGVTIVIKPGENKMTVNGVEKTLQTGAFLQHDRIFLPLRDIAESLGKKVSWDDRGIIVIGDAEITDTKIMNEIGRIL